MSRILTALKPTNILHIGNYFGAISPFLELQKTNSENFLFVADLHSLTVSQNSDELRKNIFFSVATYLACGVDPNKTILFQQSHVQEHAELCWILNCVANMGEVERMIQYKDKAKVKGESVSVGLFDYPILMAADILLYDTEMVPVGIDQKQHVELARDLAIRFNKRFGETFIVPKPVIQKTGAKIMGLDDPEKKMSKSASTDKNYISLLDDEKAVLKKIKSATTDSQGTILFDEQRHGISNLMSIYSLITNQTIEKIENQFSQKGYGDFKITLAKEISSFLNPLQKSIEQWMNSENELKRILQNGANQAQKIAHQKMEIVKKCIGIA